MQVRGHQDKIHTQASTRGCVSRSVLCFIGEISDKFCMKQWSHAIAISLTHCHVLHRGLGLYSCCYGQVCMSEWQTLYKAVDLHVQQHTTGKKL